MKRIHTATLIGLALLAGSISSPAEERVWVLTKSTWFGDPLSESYHPELHALAYDWGHLLQAKETAVMLSRHLANTAPNVLDETGIETMRKARWIRGDLDEVVLGAFDRTLPLLRKHPDKVMAQNLLLHAIRYGGGGNERWPAIIEALCLLNEEWTVEVFEKLNPGESESVPHHLREPGEAEPSETDRKILKLLEKAKAS